MQEELRPAPEAAAEAESGSRAGGDDWDEEREAAKLALELPDWAPESRERLEAVAAGDIHSLPTLRGLQVALGLPRTATRHDCLVEAQRLKQLESTAVPGACELPTEPPAGFREWLARTVDVAVSPKQAAAAWRDWQRWEPHVPEGECSTSDLLRKIARMFSAGMIQLGTEGDNSDEWANALIARADLLDGRASPAVAGGETERLRASLTRIHAMVGRDGEHGGDLNMLMECAESGVSNLCIDKAEAEDEVAGLRAECERLRGERDAARHAARCLLPFLCNEPRHLKDAVERWPWLDECVPTPAKGTEE